MSYEQDIFLWLKRPTIANIKAVLEWAHKRVLRKDIRCKNPGAVDTHPSEMEFEDILRHVNRTAKLFFRIIVRKGMNEMIRLDDKRQKDLLDICLFSVRAGDKDYDMNFYLSAGLIGALKRKFPVSEKIVH